MEKQNPAYILIALTEFMRSILTSLLNQP